MNERRDIISGQEGSGYVKPGEFSRDGKRMFNAYKNQQTFKFSDENPAQINPYVQPASKFIKDYPSPIEEEYVYEDYGAAIKENIPRASVRMEDPRRAYAQELLNQINFKNQKKAEEKYEKDQILAISQYEMQQYRDEEERKKNYARQKIKDYRDMLELQSRVKKQIGTEIDDVRTFSEPKPEMRHSKNYRSSPYNPITGELYGSDEGNRVRTETFKGNDKSLASYGNLVLQARRPY
ncbi:hypothetical protein SteCoe_12268 [Stentor coeruleus]|uniref:Uncharacterized protein n=1 Tax=Stentor coeruleus TaxID=5963 RepID=A0A1R2CBE3_9CILI|nr:hypothetical protein SteCoe_12268 [Stentor coeruleus]